jgi:chromosome segregation ATPase
MNKSVLKNLSKFEKTELSEVKVDLALVDDFNNEINAGIKKGDLLKKNINDTDRQLQSYFKLKADLETQKKTLQEDLNGIKTFVNDLKVSKSRTDKSYSEIVKRASDLGIDYPKSIDNNKKTLDDLVKYAESAINIDNVKL